MSNNGYKFSKDIILGNDPNLHYIGRLGKGGIWRGAHGKGNHEEYAYVCCAI